MATKQTTFSLNPEGGLNQDDSSFAYPEGDYWHAQDLCIGHASKGQQGAASLLAGTQAVATPLPHGRNKTIGYYEDREANRGLFFNWNEFNNHGIYELLPGGVARLLFGHQLLNFQEDKPISGIAIYRVPRGTKREALLFFTDAYNSPRCFNLDTLPTLLPAEQLEPRFLNLIKSPPLLALPVETSHNPTLAGKDLEKGVVQLIYRYVYHDFQRSTWSPVSKPVTPHKLPLAPNYLKTWLTADVLNLAEDRYRKLIKEIEVAIRFSALEPFRLWYRGYPSDLNQPLEFIDEGAYQAISDESWLEPYHGVPDTCDVLAGIDNRVVLGGLTEGFEPHQLQLADVRDVLDYPVDPLGYGMAFKNNAVAQLGVVYYDQAGRTPGAYTSEALKVRVPSKINPKGNKQFAKHFRITSAPPAWAYSYQLVRTQSLDRSYFMQGIAEDITYIRKLPDLATAQDPTYIRRQIGLVGVQDGSAWVSGRGSTSIGKNMRRIGRTDNLENYAALDTPIFEGGLDAEGKELVLNRTDYNGLGKDHNALHDEPIGRTASGKPIYFGGYNQAPNIVDKNGLQTRQPITEYMSSAELREAQYLGIDIGNWFSSCAKGTDETYPSNDLYYEFMAGDRLDLLVAQNGQEINLLNIKILEIRGSVLIIPLTENLLPQLKTPLGRGTLLEIFRPRKRDQQPLFFEVGQTYKILHPGAEQRSHEQETFDFCQGDTHLVWRSIYATNYSTGEGFYYAMHPDPARAFDFWERGEGRGHLPAISRRRHNATELRFGGQVLSDGEINDTGAFNALLNSHTYPSEYGPITLLVPAQNNMVQDVGNILLAQFRNEAVSIYINRTTLQDLSGSTQVLISDKVLGSYNTLLGSFGLQHPLASAGIDSRRYWWDGRKGMPVRYSRDGLTPLRAKMTRFFKQQARALAQVEHRVLAAWDPDGEEFRLTFDAKNRPDLSCTIVWNEARNRWTVFYSLVPEFYASLGTELITFEQGQPYLHGAGQQPNQVHNQPCTPQLSVIFNQEPGNRKEYQRLTLVADDPWAATLTSERRGARRSERTTEIKAEKFEPKGEVFSSSVPRDLNDPSLPQAHRAIDGRAMRSALLRVDLTLPAVPDLADSLLHGIVLEWASQEPKTVGK